ncbi:MAG: PDZ domain-containing protein, partial [Pseudomonadota bacterium]
WERRREAYVNGEQDRSTATSYFDELRAAVGDETFERYLNAQGLGLNVASIIPGTAAEYAGLQAGDVVQNYNGQRVFTADQLNALTVAGARGESVSIDVLRDGQTVTVTIPRGPIGIQTGGRRRGR